MKSVSIKKKPKSLNNKTRNFMYYVLHRTGIFHLFFFLSIVDNRALVGVDIQTIVELAAAVAVDMDRLDMVLKLTRKSLRRNK
jgi:hypothetical protein